MRIVFFGTPDFAAVSLKKLIDEKCEVAGVFCQPDKPSGRKMEIVFSPVKQLALNNGIPVFQPAKMRDGTALEILKSLKPDICVVVAYGRIIPDDMLAVPPMGMINVHGSLLPKYRGAAPIQWSVLNGDELAGVTTMYLDREMDTGDIIYTESTPIGEQETSGELYDRLSVMGAELLIRTLRDIGAGTAPRTPQNHSLASYVTMLDKTMSPTDFFQPARLVMRHIYGLQPWPGATAELGGETLKLFTAELTGNKVEVYGDGAATAGESGVEAPSDKNPKASCAGGKAYLPGSVVSTDKGGIEIACGDGQTVLLTEVQAPGKKRMKAADYLRGHKLI